MYQGGSHFHQSLVHRKMKDNRGTNVADQKQKQKGKSNMFI
jgi:hypothetical protein